jgi:hypothetical protein
MRTCHELATSLFLGTGVCVCECVFVSLCMYVRNVFAYHTIYKHISHIHPHTHTHIHTYIHIYIQIYIHRHIHSYTHTHTHTHIQTYTYQTWKWMRQRDVRQRRPSVAMRFIHLTETCHKTSSTTYLIPRGCTYIPRGCTQQHSTKTRHKSFIPRGCAL